MCTPTVRLRIRDQYGTRAPLPAGSGGSGGEYAGIHAGVKLCSHKRGAEYYVGVSAGRRIAMSY